MSGRSYAAARGGLSSAAGRGSVGARSSRRPSCPAGVGAGSAPRLAEARGRVRRAARRVRPERVLGRVRRGQGARGRWRAACKVRLGRAFGLEEGRSEAIKGVDGVVCRLGGCVGVLVRGGASWAWLRGWQRSGGRDCRAARRARPERVLGRVRRGQGARGRWRAACFVRLGRAFGLEVVALTRSLAVFSLSIFRQHIGDWVGGGRAACRDDVCSQTSSR